jgi:hypothetical protein
MHAQRRAAEKLFAAVPGGLPRLCAGNYDERATAWQATVITTEIVSIAALE